MHEWSVEHRGFGARIQAAPIVERGTGVATFPVLEHKWLLNGFTAFVVAELKL